MTEPLPPPLPPPENHAGGPEVERELPPWEEEFTLSAGSCCDFGEDGPA